MKKFVLITFTLVLLIGITSLSTSAFAEAPGKVRTTSVELPAEDQG